jgi:hypothetical protein
MDLSRARTCVGALGNHSISYDHLSPPLSSLVRVRARETGTVIVVAIRVASAAVVQRCRHGCATLVR